MPRFPETHTKSDTLSVLADSESQATKTPLMKQAEKPLMQCEFMRLIPAALCSSRPSSYDFFHQIRNGTCTPPLFLNNQRSLFSSCLSAALPHNIFVLLCTAHRGGCTELSSGKKRTTLKASMGQTFVRLFSSIFYSYLASG